MAKITLGLDLEFSDDEMRDFLIKKGYAIESHECNTLSAYGFPGGSGITMKNNIELALNDEDSNIISRNEYKMVFKRVIKESFKNIIKDFVLFDLYS